MAVNISNYKKRPVIGKVTEVFEDEFQLNYWKGTYNAPWQPHMVRTTGGEVPWADTIPKKAVILCSFQLDEANRLLENTRRFIKRWYCVEAKRQSSTSMNNN